MMYNNYYLLNNMIQTIKNPLGKQWQQYDSQTDIGLLTLYQHQNRSKYALPYQNALQAKLNDSQQQLPIISQLNQKQASSSRKKQISIFHHRNLKGKYLKTFGNRYPNRAVLDRQRIEDNKTMNQQVIKMKQYNFGQSNEKYNKQKANCGFRLFKQYCTVEGQNQKTVYSKEQLLKIFNRHKGGQQNRLTKIKLLTKEHVPMISPRIRFKTLQHDNTTQRKLNEYFSDRKVNYFDGSIPKHQVFEHQANKTDSKSKRNLIKQILTSKQKKSSHLMRQSNLLNNRINKPISFSLEDTQNAKINQNRIKQLIKSYLKTVNKRQSAKKLTILQSE